MATEKRKKSRLQRFVHLGRNTAEELRKAEQQHNDTKQALHAALSRIEHLEDELEPFRNASAHYEEKIHQLSHADEARQHEYQNKVAELSAVETALQESHARVLRLQAEMKDLCKRHWKESSARDGEIDVLSKEVACLRIREGQLTEENQRLSKEPKRLRQRLQERAEQLAAVQKELSTVRKKIFE